MRGNRAQHIRAGIPQWIEQTSMRAQFMQPLCGPGQMIFFLNAGMRKLLLQGSRLCKPSLRIVKRLSAHLAHMIDTHQAGTMALFSITERHLAKYRGGIWARRRYHPAHHTQRFIEFANELINELHDATFLQIDVCQTLAQSSFHCMVSPPLSGTTVVSPIGNSAGIVQLSRRKLTCP